MALKIAQRVSCTLHRENARAVLQRTAVGGPAALESGWVVTEEVAAWGTARGDPGVLRSIISLPGFWPRPRLGRR